MHNASSHLFTNARPVSRGGKIVQFPLVRIIIAILFLMPVSIISFLVGPDLARQLQEPFATIVKYGRDIFFLLLFMILYGLYTKYVERREALEISLRKFLPELGIGMLLSMFMVGLMVVLMASLGYYTISSFNSAKNLTDAFVLQMMVGFSEELLFRLIVFKLVEEFAGSWIAVIVQGLIFGFAHIANPNATLFTSLGLVFSDTLLFGGAYMLTRRIWLIMGIHWSWNFFQAGVFGMPNSGTTRPGWLVPEISGPEWLTGGAWGIEASVVALLMQFLIGLYIFRKAVSKGQLVPPVWIRRKFAVAAESAGIVNTEINKS